MLFKNINPSFYLWGDEFLESLEVLGIELLLGPEVSVNKAVDPVANRASCSPLCFARRMAILVQVATDKCCGLTPLSLFGGNKFTILLVFWLFQIELGIALDCVHLTTVMVNEVERVKSWVDSHAAGINGLLAVVRRRIELLNELGTRFVPRPRCLDECFVEVVHLS